jgi:hypothetical protein
VEIDMNFINLLIVKSGKHILLLDFLTSLRPLTLITISSCWHSVMPWNSLLPCLVLPLRGFKSSPSSVHCSCFYQLAIATIILHNKWFQNSWAYDNKHLFSCFQICKWTVVQPNKVGLTFRQCVYWTWFQVASWAQVTLPVFTLYPAWQDLSHWGYVSPRENHQYIRGDAQMPQHMSSLPTLYPLTFHQAKSFTWTSQMSKNRRIAHPS